MKCLSLLDPWGTAILLGIKTKETRSWRTQYRGPIAIHVSRGKKKEGRKLFEDLVLQGIFPPGSKFDDLPFGKIIAITELRDCIPTRVAFDRLDVNDVERQLGDYTAGRWAWELGKVLKLRKPIPCSGGLSLWTPPDDINQELDFAARGFFSVVA